MTFFKCYGILKFINKLFTSMLLTKFNVISFDELSMFTTIISIIVTLQNTFVGCGLNEGGILMTTVFSIMVNGTYEVNI